ncbi:TldD/PmbA family protein, partial [Dehalococcoidia bacterium]|nr:TldD/PmbA family protein [Dehalococcoidia bacterium]
KHFEKTPDEHLNFILHTYNKSLKEVSPRGGKMKVLFLPDTMYSLIWRLQSATNGKNIYEKKSPVSEKLGQEIFNRQLTIYNDPLNDDIPGARSFDDEGTPCRYFPVVENGILQNFYYDLHYAAKLKASPTGHGFRSAMWGGDSIATKPTPSLDHLFIKPGDKSLSELIKSIDCGIIIAGVLGAHSGNIPNGDFSMGLSPGLYVENGEIVGNVKDAMVAGNIYEVMKNVLAIEDTLYPAMMGTFPAILFDSVSVATKS